MTDERDEIRSRIDIVELVGQSISLKKVGRSIKGLCPFHADKNPSLHISPEFGRYTCFACGAKGDIFDWVMNIRHVDFKEALEILAEQAGVTLHKKSQVDVAQATARKTVMEEALSFFRNSLETDPGARAYCTRRGLDAETIKHWEIGFAPDVSEAIPVHLQRKQHKLAECVDLFLVDRDSSGGYYGRFRNRLMFPIRNERGELVAFGGRALGDTQPKYVNSGDTPLYKKSRVLYGLNLAKDHIAKSGTAVLCEGYMDVIACYRAGIKTAVASLGTALTEDQARLLKRWGGAVTILYDGDDAGQNATEKALVILGGEGIDARVALLPKGQDPDTILKNEGAEALQTIVKSAVSPLDYRVNMLEKRVGTNTEAFWNEVVPVLATATSEIALSRHLVRLSGTYPGLHDPISAQRALRRQIDQHRASTNQRTKPAATSPGPTKSPHTPLIHRTESVLFRALISESLRSLAYEAVKAPDLIFSPQGILLRKNIVEQFPDGPPSGAAATWFHRLPQQTQDILETLGEFDGDEAFVKAAIRSLEIKRSRREVTALRTSGGEDRLETIQRRLQELQSDT